MFCEPFGAGMLDVGRHRLIRYIFAGGLNTAFGFVVYSLLALTEMPTWLVLVVSSCISMIFNFFTAGGIVFFDLNIRRIPRFVLSYVVILLTYLELIEWLSPSVGGRIWAMAIIVVPMAAVTYLVQSVFVFASAQIASRRDS